jgi:hypothetical protein
MSHPETEQSEPLTYRRREMYAILFILALVSLVYCNNVLRGINNWGKHDWDQHLFYNATVYRSVMEFGEIPLWNPWYMGGNPQLGNPQIQFPTPMFALDLIGGPILGMKLKIVLHHWIGLVGMVFLARRLGMSIVGSLLAAAGFMLSNWYALHLYVGHSQFLSMAYMPWFILCLRLAGSRAIYAVPAALCLALIVFEGGAYTAVFTVFLSGYVSLGWSLQNRSWRPLSVFILTLGLSAGLAAVRVIPVGALLIENPRYTKISGDAWKITPVEMSQSQEREADKESLDTRLGKPAPIPRSKFALLLLFAKIFFGRDQRGETTYFVLQGFYWQEYGAYMGPVIAFILLFSPLVLKKQWPWMFAAVGCFAIALGTFATWSPWAILHHMPVTNNIRCPTRFLMPFSLASSILAGFTFDALRARFAARALVKKSGELPRSRVPVVSVIILLVCAIDMTSVSITSFAGAFSEAPPAMIEKSPKLITIRGNPMKMLLPMFRNFCTKDGYELAHVPVKVLAVDDPTYRGEAGFFASRPAETALQASRSPSAEVEITAWSPNSVTLHVKTDEAGSIFVNRNWDKGWKSTSHYNVFSQDGLVASAVTSGEHTIHYSYLPPGVLIGATMSLTTLMITGLWGWRVRRQRRKAA